MSQNYFLEFRYIPSIIDRCKKGILPFNALTDIELWKKELEQFDCEINWDELTIEILDELGIAENLRLGTGHKIGEYYVIYTFPAITVSPEAKYGVIRYNAEKNLFDYYTFESDMSGAWYIGGQTLDTHYNYGQHADMSKEEFVTFVKNNLVASNKYRTIIIVSVIIIITFLISIMLIK